MLLKFFKKRKGLRKFSLLPAHIHDIVTPCSCLVFFCNDPSPVAFDSDATLYYAALLLILPRYSSLLLLLYHLSSHTHAHNKITNTTPQKKTVVLDFYHNYFRENVITL